MLEHIGTTSRFMTLMSHNFGAIQVLRNAVGGGGGVWFNVVQGVWFNVICITRGWVGCGPNSQETFMCPMKPCVQ